jgi:formate-dependent nitrite reductase membrane component NrfD
MNEIAYQEEYDRRENRRDMVSRTLKMLSFVSIGIIVLLAVLIALAQPASYAVIDKRPGLSATWDPVLCPILFSVMVAGFLVAIAGLVLNAKRLKRKHDFLRVNLILLTIASLLGIIIYLIR